MEIVVGRRDARSVECEALVALVPRGERLPRWLAPLDQAAGGAPGAFYAAGDFAGKADETLQVPATGLAAKRLFLVGLGAEREIDAEALRRAAGRAVGAALRRRATSVALLLPPLRRPAPAAIGQALAEGAALAGYRFDKYRTANDNPKPIGRLELLPADARTATPLRQGARVGQTVAHAVALTRDLSNEPGGVCTPAFLAEQARKLGRETGLRVRVFDEKELERRAMGGLLAVGRGAANPPRLIVLEHAPRQRKGGRPALALVGKGITFDSGGISLKGAANMEQMKHDMSGGAAVFGALRAAAELRLPLHLLGVVAAAQNMPDGNAYIPGDVVRTASGKTIEVLNTDAEGRIVLADALHYAAGAKPGAIVDLATLTGACKQAFGGFCCGLLGNDERLATKVRQAGERAHERAWPLPLWAEHKERIKSHVADIKNTGGPDAGTSTAAAFLSHFVGEVPWAHLDIAGTESTNNEHPYCVKGATGFGVRLLVELLRAWR
jgi:leucyl aminopeptidase